MWQWSSTVAEYAEAAAFTQRRREPEPSFTEPGFAVAESSDGAGVGEVCEGEESSDAGDLRAPRRSLPRCPGYDLVG